MKKRIFSGAQPTGQLHLGNYLGALKNWVALQDDYESFFCIVNLHAITMPQDPKVLRQKTLDLARIYLAAGVDPQKSTIFIQSDVPEHAELAWVLSCVARMGELERMTQFKDKSSKFRNYVERKLNDDTLTKLLLIVEGKAKIGGQIEELKEKLVDVSDSSFMEFVRALQNFNKKRNEKVGVGLFTYPVLMASDILLYQTDLVPVGQDQKQHLELTRDVAERFNRDYGQTFTIPEPYIPPVGANIRSLQNPHKKMSKSDENAEASIFLLDNADTVTKKIKRAVTDSGTDIRFDDSRPAITNLLTIYQIVTGKSNEECETRFEGKGYGQFKTELAEAVVEFLRPFQEKIEAFDDDSLEAILKPGAERARAVASATLRDAYAKMGIGRGI